jgi:hypothetical protein
MDWEKEYTAIRNVLMAHTDVIRSLLLGGACAALHNTVIFIDSEHNQMVKLKGQTLQDWWMKEFAEHQKRETAVLEMVKNLPYPTTEPTEEQVVALRSLVNGHLEIAFHLQMITRIDIPAGGVSSKPIGNVAKQLLNEYGY